MFKKHKPNRNFDQLVAYANLPREDSSINPIEWWARRLEDLSILSIMAMNYLSVPASSVASEQTFSKSGNLINKKRNRLDTKTVRTVMTLDSWIKFANHN